MTGYARLGIPVDLAHGDRLEKALATAAALSRTFSAPIAMVAVTSPAPNALARDPQAFGERLETFAADCGERHGVIFEPHVRICDDPVAELDRSLSAAFHELGVDLVVLASHVPGFREYLFASHGGWLASHTDLSVFVVR